MNAPRARTTLALLSLGFVVSGLTATTSLAAVAKTQAPTTTVSPVSVTPTDQLSSQIKVTGTDPFVSFGSTNPFVSFGYTDPFVSFAYTDPFVSH